jgi:hypothetical protein
MKTKRKNESKQSTITYLWNEFLFTKSFYFETDLPPDECARHLRSLIQEKSGFWMPTKQTVEIDSPKSGHITFDIRHKRYSRAIPYTTAKATGRIYEDGRATIIEGEVKFGWVYYLFLLLPVVYIALLFTVVPRMKQSFIFLIVMGIFIAFYGLIMFNDRNTLIGQLGNALEYTKPKREPA